MKKSLLYTAFFAILMLSACTASKRTTASYHTYPTECISQNADGKLLLRAWATGEFRKESASEAEKRALEDVIFNGITAGATNRSQIALVIDANARDKYEDYFNAFFADGGSYTQYVTRDVHHVNSQVRLKNKGTKNGGYIVLVDRPALKARLKQDGIIK